jgi:hypothetical protein
MGGGYLGRMRLLVDLRVKQKGGVVLGSSITTGTVILVDGVKVVIGSIGVQKVGEVIIDGGLLVLLLLLLLLRLLLYRQAVRLIELRNQTGVVRLRKLKIIRVVLVGLRCRSA